MAIKTLLKGPLTTASGYGVHARQVFKALLLAPDLYDVSVKLIGWGNTPILHEDSALFNKIRELSLKYEMEAKSNTKYDLSVQVTIPNEFEKLARINVGVTAGIEVNVCSPQWLLKINENVDAVIVPSKHSLDVLCNSVFQDQNGGTLSIQKPVFLEHEGFDSSVFNTSETEDLITLDTDFNFLYVGLGISIEDDRKNTHSLIKWFCETFKGRKDVGLVMKTSIINGSLMDFDITKMKIDAIKKVSNCGEYPKITLVHGRMSDTELAALYKHSKVKAFISLTHGEGFGLPLLEAAACGLPVITTGWSGHLDFLYDGSGKKFIDVEYELKQIPQSAVWDGVMENGTSWAYPKEDDAKLKMRKIVASYNKPKEWATELAKSLEEKFSERVVTTQLAGDLARFVIQHRRNNPATVDELVASLRAEFKTDGKNLLYTMPMSAGDVYISTAVVNSLKKKFPDHKIFFATKEQYKDILKQNKDIFAIIEYSDWMTDTSICERVFDEVYTPNMSVQMTFSNWVHGGKGRLLANELATQCGVELGKYFIETEQPNTILPTKYIAFNPGSGKGQWEARNYVYWQDVITNLARELKDVKIVQVGLEDDPLYEGAIDFRGKTKNLNELAYVVKNSQLMLGIDSVTTHLAAGLGVNHVALFGSSYSTSTGPVVQLGQASILLETPNRYSCDKACYKYTCSVDKDHPCINEIDPKEVYMAVLEVVGYTCKADEKHPMLNKLQKYKETLPKISGYTHVLNAESGGYPYVESITSMLGFCDEVIVVDGGSDDGTLNKIKAIDDPRVSIVERKWDWSEPGMDGMQKAYGRAMCTGDYLWQQDVDEVVHEEDYEKIKKLVKRFPKSVDLVHLPVVELWGNDKTVRTDRHSWKWRLSRNNFRITHGIAKHARLINEKTGKTYSRKGQSDGCEFIDIMSHEYIQHAGFYNGTLEEKRVRAPQLYGEEMNDIFENLPSVYHYSWCDLKRKITNFKTFWNTCWSNLYNDETPNDRFPDVDLSLEESVNAKVSELLELGGEHGKAETFVLRRSNPKIMEKWLAH